MNHTQIKRAFPLFAFILCCSYVTRSQIALQWAKSMGGPTAEGSSKMAMDAAGNIYLTGNFTGTADFDPGPGVSNLVAVDNVDLFIQKLDAAGSLVWAKGIGSVGQDLGEGIAVDAEGNVYVTGFYQGTADFDPDTGVFNLTPAGQLDGFVVKLDTDGNLAWAGTFGGPTFENGQGITLDASGNVLFCGYYTGTADFDPSPATSTLTSAGNNDAFVCKLSADGDFIWAKGMGGIGTEIAFEIALDKLGNIHTVGRFSHTADFDPGPATINKTAVGNDDIFISKLDSSGNFLWVKTIGSPNIDNGYAIEVDSLSNVYTTGYFISTADFDPGFNTTHNLTAAGGRDAFISKLDSNGLFVWAKRLGSSTNDEGLGLFAKPSGELWCTGYFSGTVDIDPGAGSYNLISAASSNDAFVLKLDSLGEFSMAFSIGDTLADAGMDLQEDANGNLVCNGRYVASPDFDPSSGAYNLTSNGNSDVFVSKYFSDMSVGRASTPGGEMPCNIYPNPTASQVTIFFHEEQINTSIRIMDAMGREVKAFVLSGQEVTIEKGNMGKGVYFVEIKSLDNKLVSKKLVIL